MPVSARHIEVIARGVLLRQGHTLLCFAGDGVPPVITEPDHALPYCYLPGGHIELGETAADALRREFREECGLRVTVRGLEATAEHRFTRKGMMYHELLMVFRVERPGGGLLRVESRESDISFAWVPHRVIKKLDYRPAATAQWACGVFRQRWASLFPRG
jgi:ADP-ribose pyrophosphatase YjhB (NUDIX family)